MKNILLTGSNGYIANSILNNMSHKYNFILLNRNICDLMDAECIDMFLKNQSFDCVIHTAAIGGSRLCNDTTDVIKNNLVMFYNLFKHKHLFNRFIYFGSGAEIYSQLNPYGFAKKIISDIIINNDKFFNLRIFGVFDENELSTRFIKSNILKYIKYKNLEIHQNKIMDFIYMKDLINIVDYYISNENPPKQIDCCYAEHKSLLEICEIINSLNNYHRSYISINNTGVCENYYGNYHKLPIKEYGLIQGIKNTYRAILLNEYIN